MRNQTNFLGSVTFLLLMLESSLMAADGDRVLFEFSSSDAAKAWQTVNDGVMGGLSDGQFKISNEKTMEFFGTLSLENSGGFASVRSSPIEAKLGTGDSIAARVRGDGRQYSINLYVPRGFGGYSFRQSFKTKKDEWIEVSFPMDEFVATYRGRVFPTEKLDPSKVNSVGFLLGDKKAGRFKLEVEWIKVEPASDAAYGNVSCEFDCSLGIVGLPDGRLLSASGRCDKEKGCTGTVRLVVPNEKSGFEFCEKE